MNLIVDKEIFIEYLESIGQRFRNKNVLDLIQIFENEDNIFLISKYLIERVELEISKNPQLINEFQAFITHIVYEKRFISQSLGKAEVESNEIIEIFNKNIETTETFVFLKQNRVCYNSIKQNCCFFNDIIKPNKNWIILKLASQRSLSVRYLDFNNNLEIHNFFKDYFDFNKNSNEVIILDSYCNLHRHNLFSPIVGNGQKVSIYTSSFRKTEFEKGILRKEVKNHFNSKTSVKFSSDKSLIHERTIMINNIILEINHDFAEVKRSNRNWKIDISYDYTLKQETLSKCNKYN